MENVNGFCEDNWQVCPVEQGQTSKQYADYMSYTCPNLSFTQTFNLTTSDMESGGGWNQDQECKLMDYSRNTDYNVIDSWQHTHDTIDIKPLCGDYLVYNASISKSSRNYGNYHNVTKDRSNRNDGNYHDMTEDRSNRKDGNYHDLTEDRSNRKDGNYHDMTEDRSNLSSPISSLPDILEDNTRHYDTDLPYIPSYTSQNSKTEERLKRRREKNKVAAMKCRERKRQLYDYLRKQSQDLESRNTSLNYEINLLNKEVTSLKTVINNHKVQCSKPHLVISTEPLSATCVKPSKTSATCHISTPVNQADPT